jgi:PAS domain S-box-containing protein
MASTYSLQYKRRDRHTIQAVQNQTLKQRIRRGYFLQISAVFVAYVIAGKLGQATVNIRSSNLGPVWPAYGIALAGILICGYRVWLGVAAGAFLVAFFSPVPHIAALGQAAGASLAATTGAFLLHRTAKFHSSLSRLSDVLSLIALGGFGSAIVSASLGVAVLYATHVHAYSGLGAAWLIYWLGDATGVLLVTPLVLRFKDFSKLPARDRITELAILLLLLAATCSVIFGDLPFIPVKLHFMAFAVLPLIMWAAIRFSVGVTAFSILIVAATATAGTALGSGPFTSNTTFVNAVLLDVFFGVLSVSGLSLAAVIAERENAEREREQVVSKQAAMEARLRADEALRESEERLRLAQQAARIGTFDWNIRTGVNTWTPELEEMYGLPPGGFGGTQTAFENLVHPDDRARVIELVDAAMKSGQPIKGEWRVLWTDASVHWIAGRWQVFMDASGEPSKMIGVNIDVTERKRAAEELLEVNRRLIEAQEQERARIGRELHDDVNQRLAMLAIELEQLADNPSEVRSRAQELRKQTTEISDDVQALSHELHSSKLEYLGAIGGLKSWCKEFSERQRVELDFNNDVHSALPFEIGLSLFRVLQEALHNVMKHSGVKRIEVQLREDSGGIHLIIRDSGRGFDVKAASQGKGLGLTSMRERVRLVNGTISIESKPMGGTTIHVRVPLASEHEADRAAG